MLKQIPDELALHAVLILSEEPGVNLKYADIEQLQRDGLITQESKQRIVAHYKLDAEGSRFLTILSFIGGALILCGVLLVIGANWNDIPHLTKIAVGLLLMTGSYALGYRLRENNGNYPKVGEVFYLIGSGMFLANIALIGQIYHLSSRAPNAIRDWLLAICLLPWILNSKAQYWLTLVAFLIWFGMEVNAGDVALFINVSFQLQLLMYASVGLLYLGIGYHLSHTRWTEFSELSKRFGLLIFHVAMYPLTWSYYYSERWDVGFRSSTFVRPVLSPAAVFWIIAAIATTALLTGIRRKPTLSSADRIRWSAAILGIFGLFAFILLAGTISISAYGSYRIEYPPYSHVLGSAVLFLFCLAQIQAGIVERIPALVSLGVWAIGLNVCAVYLSLFGSMGVTGISFVGTGVLLIATAIFLEKRRRKLLRSIRG